MRTADMLSVITTAFPETKPEEAAGYLVVPKETLPKLARYLKEGEPSFDNLHCITAIDRKDRIELVYSLYSIRGHRSLCLRVPLAYEDLNISSLTGIWKSANWLEREVYDLFGVTFLDHPDLRRILNPYDWKEYPLRKSYECPNG